MDIKTSCVSIKLCRSDTNLYNGQKQPDLWPKYTEDLRLLLGASPVRSWPLLFPRVSTPADFSGVLVYFPLDQFRVASEDGS